MSNEPEIINATSLDDLGMPVMEITIPRPDGKWVNVKLKALSEGELWALRKNIKWPDAPISNYRPGGIPVYNYQDETYLQKTSECNQDLAGMAIIKGLQLAIPGETDSEKLETLKAKLGNYAWNLLVTASNRLNLVGEEEIAAVAASFRPEGTPYTPPAKSQGLDAGPVAQSAAG